MATSTDNIVIGAGVVSVGAWVTAGGAGSLTDVGHTKTPVTLAITHELFEVTSERVGGVVRSVPQMTRAKLKVPMQEGTPEHWRIALRQAAANLTGAPPDLTLVVGEAAEQEHQVQVVTPGLGSTNVRTFTFWKCTLESVSEVPFAKGGEQIIEITFDVLLDESLATDDKLFKMVET